MKTIPASLPAALITVILFLTFQAQAQTPSEEWDARVKRNLETYIGEDNVGLVVGGIHDGKEYRQYLGSQLLRRQKNLNAETIFQVGSVTKTFTSLVLAQLVQQKKLNLEDPISKFLPELLDSGGDYVNAITLRQLSTHTSGLPSLPANFQSHDPRNPYDDYTPDQTIEALETPGLLAHLGPYPMSYSNMGAGLLGYILTRVTGLSYEKMISEMITEPLAMKNTGIERNDDQRERSARGYDDTFTFAPFWEFLPSFVGAGGIHSTLSDMLLYLKANLDPDQTPLGLAIALSHEVQAYGSADSVGLPPSSNIGLAWVLNSINGDDIVWHNGEVGGYASFTAINRTTHEAIELMTNTANVSFQGCLFALLTRKDCAPLAVDFPLSPSEMRDRVGDYRFQSGPIPSLKIRERRDFLMATAAGQNFRLRLTSANECSLADGTLLFGSTAQGVTNQLTFTEGKVSNTAIKVIKADDSL